MSKKAIIMIVVVVVVAVVVLLVALGGCKHEWGEWQEAKIATCTEDGLNTRVCNVCGESQSVTIYAQGHSFSAWNTTQEETCTVNGIRERVCSCGEKETQTIAAIGHQYTWITVKEATCLQTGEKRGTCLTCNDVSTQSIPLSTTHVYNSGVVTKEATCNQDGSKTFTCTICNHAKTEPISKLGHNIDQTGKCKRCGIVTLNMTSAEIEKSKKVSSMRHSIGEYSDELDINITLKDSNSYAVQVPVYVDVKIVDDEGNVLYSKTLIKKSSQSVVTIDYDEIMNAYTNTGTLYYRVYNDYVSFDEISKELEKIPWTVDVQLPTLPQIISSKTYSGSTSSSCKVTGITYKVSGDDIVFYFTGEKTYDANGNNYSRSCSIGWKLYDSDGYVVEDGTCYSTTIKVGEKFKDASATAFDVIEQGKTYTLVIMNVS